MPAAASTTRPDSAYRRPRLSLPHLRSAGSNWRLADERACGGRCRQATESVGREARRPAGHAVSCALDRELLQRLLDHEVQDPARVDPGAVRAAEYQRPDTLARAVHGRGTEEVGACRAGLADRLDDVVGLGLRAVQRTEADAVAAEEALTQVGTVGADDRAMPDEGRVRR